VRKRERERKKKEREGERVRERERKKENKRERKKENKRERERKKKRERTNKQMRERERERKKEQTNKQTRERELLQKLLDFPKFRDQTFEIKYLVPKFEMLTKYFSFPIPFSGTGKLRSLVLNTDIPFTISHFKKTYYFLSNSNFRERGNQNFTNYFVKKDIGNCTQALSRNSISY